MLETTHRHWSEENSWQWMLDVACDGVAACWGDGYLVHAIRQ